METGVRGERDRREGGAELSHGEKDGPAHAEKLSARARVEPHAGVLRRREQAVELADDGERGPDHQEVVDHVPQVGAQRPAGEGGVVT